MKRLFLVYGTLKKAHGNHRVIGHPTTKFLGEFTTESKYTMYDGGFPIVRRDGETAITGELYEVSDQDTIDDVFGLEGCTTTQHSAKNWYDFDLIKTPFGEATMFVMNKRNDEGGRIVESGKWR